MNKSEIRLLVQEKISQLSDETKKLESQNVCKQLINMLSREKFDTLISYDAFSDEIDVSHMEKWGKGHGKNVIIVPQSLDKFIPPNESIIIVPGRAFTKDGKRIGRGSGFYDKVLAANTMKLSIGVCFECQVFENLPEDNWDKKMDEVVFRLNTLR